MVTNWVDRHSSISRPAAGRQQRGPNGISLSAEPTSAFVCPRRAPRALEKLAAWDGERSERGESLWPSRRFATGYEQPATTRNSDGGTHSAAALDLPNARLILPDDAARPPLAYPLNAARKRDASSLTLCARREVRPLAGILEMFLGRFESRNLCAAHRYKLNGSGIKLVSATSLSLSLFLFTITSFQ